LEIALWKKNFMLLLLTMVLLWNNHFILPRGIPFLTSHHLQ
jgi:hypothetical protein